MVVGTGARASAQVVIDPEVVEFDASPDHDAITAMGSAAVQDYELSLYFPGSTVPVLTANLGKPTPSGGRIRVRFVSLLPSAPTPGVTFEARVSAVGPGGRTSSPPSNQFSFGSACTYTLSPGAQSLPAAGGTASVTVTTAPGCRWTASSSAGWLTLTSASSGTGSGTVTVEGTENAGASGRSASLTIGGETATISQDGVSCSYALSASKATVPADGGSGSVSLTAKAGCTWSASSSASWLTIESGGAGSGSGTITYVAAVNVTSSQRSGTISAGGRTLTVVQPGVSCTFALAPTSLIMASSESSGSLTMSAPLGCTWAASSNAPWLTITGGASGSGGAAITFSATANTGAARTALVSAGGRTVTVNQQAASPCTYAITPRSRNITAATTTGTISLTTAAGCAWTAAASVPWVSLKDASGNGSGTITYTVSANDSTILRTAEISAGGQTLLLTQAGASCSFALSPAAATQPSYPSIGSFEMTTPKGCTWVPSSTAAWLRVTSAAYNSGPGSVTYSVTTNVSSSERTATIVAGGKTFTVTQAAASPCTFELSADKVILSKAATEGALLVTVGGGCPLTATSNASWLSVKGIDQASGTVRYAVTANTQIITRTASLQIGSSVFTVSQRSTGAPLPPGGVEVTGMGGGR
jgi:hypothetical protein